MNIKFPIKNKTKNLFTIIGSGIFLIVVILLIFNFGASSTNQKFNDSIIKDFTLSQLVSMVGQPVKWTKTIETSSTEKNQHFLEIPKNSDNIKVTILKHTENKEKVSNNIELTNADRIKLSQLAAERANSKESLALSQSLKYKPVFFANFLSNFTKSLSFMFAAVEDTVGLGEVTTSLIDISSITNATSTEVSTTSEEQIESTSTEPEQIVSSTSTEATTTEPVTEATTTEPETTKIVQVEYETPAPVIAEATTDTGKVITVSAADTPDAPVTNVLAFTNIPEIYKVGQEDKIKIKWVNNGDQNVEFHAYDLNGNGKLDYVEWTVPHLSTQTFEIIFISKAFQLDSNKDILSDIYDQVQYKDNVWTTITDGQYVRVTFEQILTNRNDNTLYARPTSSSTPGSVQIYPVYTANDGTITVGDSPVASIDNINHEAVYRTILSNLQTPTDMFDLKVTGSIDIDYIVDPTPLTVTDNFNDLTKIATTTNLSVNGGKVGLALQLFAPSAPVSTSTILGTTGSKPMGIAMDSLGNIYTANYDSNNVSKITPAGTSTVLGTTGTRPIGITVDSSGNVYTANYQSSNVSKITQSGTSTILATTEYGPYDIVLDQSNNVYTANSTSNSVSKITPTGTSTVLGVTGSGPRSLTIDSSGNIYTANYTANSVSKITPTGTSTILGTTGSYPYGIVVDPSGNIYTANGMSDTITKITSLGATSTINASYYPYSLAIDSYGNFYTLGYMSDNVNSVSPIGASTILGNTGTTPVDIIRDSYGNIYTANSASNNVTKINKIFAVAGNATATVYFPASLSDGGSPITGYTVTSSPAGGVDTNSGSTTLSHLITGLTNGTTYTFTVTATNAIGTSAASAASNSVTPIGAPSAPTGLASVSGDKQVSLSWSAPSNGGSPITGYKVYIRTGTLGATTTYSMAANTNPYDIAFDGTNMWTANYNGNSVTKITPTGATTTYAGIGALPYGISFDGTNMWTANYSGDSVTKITSAGATTTFTLGAGTNPRGIAFDGTNMWTAGGSNTIRKITSGGVVTPYSLAANTYPYGIAFDGTNMWSANSNGGVTKITSIGGMTTYAIADNPRGIAFDGTNMWTSGNNVTKINITTGATTTYTGTGNSPYDIAFDGTNMWTSNYNGHSVTKITPTGATTTYPIAAGAYPKGIAFDGTDIWTANSGTNNVTKIFTGVTKTLGNVTSTTTSGLINGTTYYYQVSAINAIGEGPLSAEIVAYPGSKKVFVTSTTYNGNLGGLSGADAKCAARATAGSLSGTWKAWISSGATDITDARDRLTHNSYAYMNTHGDVVATSWTDLVDGSLAAAIQYNEFGGTGGYGVWTGTNSDGTHYFSQDCSGAGSGWTSSTGTGGDVGINGIITSTSGTWSNSGGATGCSSSLPLYCFEQ